MSRTARLASLYVNVELLQDGGSREADGGSDADDRERRPKHDRLYLAADVDRKGVGHANHAPQPSPGGDRPQDRDAGAGDDVAEQVHHTADPDREPEHRIASTGRKVEVRTVRGPGGH